MTSLLCLSFLLQQAPATGCLVMEGDVETAQDLKLRAGLSLDQLGAHLEKHGYFEVREKGVAIYFSPAIWQQKAMDKSLALYRELNQAIRPDHTIDFSQAPAMQSYVNDSLASAGYQMGDGGTSAIGVSRTVNLKLGDKTMALSVSPNGNKLGAAVGGPKLQPISDEDKKKAQARSPQVVRDPRREIFYCYGPALAKREAEQNWYRRATELLGAHLMQYGDKHRVAMQQVIDALCGYSMKDFLGAGFSGLPSDLQNQLKSAANGAYTQMGFGSPAEAQAALSQSVISNSSSNVSVMCNGIGFQLP